MAICPQCATEFSLTDADKTVLERFKVPQPRLCPDCRQQRRCAFRNESKLYQRTCSRCGKSIIAIFSTNKPFLVYCPECYWSDEWDGRSFGREYDFNRSFFEQFQELQRFVPVQSNNVVNSENCLYNNYCLDSKDCYMSVRLSHDENILYSYLALNSLACVDCYNVIRCQYCYECVDVWDCYNCFFSVLCKNSSDLAFCYDCIGCRNCFGCVGLRNAEYCFFNEKYSKEEYQQKLKQYYLGSYNRLVDVKRTFFEKDLIKFPRRALQIVNSENAFGNHIDNSRDIHYCFDVDKTESARYGYGIYFSRDVWDCSFTYGAENCYENISNYESSNILFSYVTYAGTHDVQYCMMCYNGTHDCFGCIGLKKEQYCILNKQYSKEEYEEIVPRIIDSMRVEETRNKIQTNSKFEIQNSTIVSKFKIRNSKFTPLSYGEFFPVIMSYFAYNETVAQSYFPLSRDEVLARGWKWKDEETKERHTHNYQLPDDIAATGDEVSSQVFSCSCKECSDHAGKACERNFKIIPQELAFHKQFSIALPRFCPECRSNARARLRSPRRLYERTCQKCGKRIMSAYGTESPETVWCSECYTKG